MAAQVPIGGAVRCKPRHKWTHPHDLGELRSPDGQDQKSRCPGWIADASLQARLMADALVEDDVPLDRHGRPKRLWNAIGGMVFIGVSTQENAPAYNCYPEYPATDLVEELELRKMRSVEEFMNASAP